MPDCRPKAALARGEEAPRQAHLPLPWTALALLSFLHSVCIHSVRVSSVPAAWGGQRILASDETTPGEHPDRVQAMALQGRLPPAPLCPEAGVSPHALAEEAPSWPECEGNRDSL